MRCDFDSRYCSRCHGEMTKDDYCYKQGWCKHCKESVEVSCCKVPYWIIAVTLVLTIGLLGRVHVVM